MFSSEKNILISNKNFMTIIPNFSSLKLSQQRPIKFSFSEKATKI